MGVSSYKRCGCRDPGTGKPLGQACPKLRRADGRTWSGTHGTWYGKAELPAAPDGTRLSLRQGGFGGYDEMAAWFKMALALLDVPEAGAEGHAARAEILGLIRESRRKGDQLPSRDDIARLHQAGVPLTSGSTGDYLLSWVKQHQQSGDLAATTLHGYARTIRVEFIPAFGNVPLLSLRPRHVTGWLAGIEAANQRLAAAHDSPDPEERRAVAGRVPTSLASRKRYLAVLKSALGEAASPERRLIPVNPAAGIRLGRGTRKTGRPRARLWTAGREQAWREELAARLKASGGTGSVAEFAAWRNTAARPGRVMVWTPAHLGRFLDAAEDDRLYALFCETGYCGFRRAETVGQEWTATDLGNATVLVEATIVEVGYEATPSDPKTHASEAHVHLDDVSVAALRAWRKQQAAERMTCGPDWPGTGKVFTQPDGHPYQPSFVSRRFERIAYGAGLPPISFRDLRHCAATIALAGGADITAVSRMLRHASIRITADIYTEVLPELAAEVASKVAAMVPRKNSGATGGPTTVPQGLPGRSR